MKKLLLSLLFLSGLVFSQSVVINEVMSSNDTTIYDEDGDASDWIELYNSGNSQINLSGYYLSDDSSEATKWQFGNAVVEPGEYLLVFASDKDTLIDYWHTNFKISAGGEEIVLSDSSGTVVDMIYVPESETDISYGRESDGAITWMFQDPTPGSENTGNAIPDYADPVVASIDGGFYPSSIDVELTAGDSEIFYTLDGSDPDSTSTKYTAPITIGKTTVLKATGIKTNFLPSPITYQTYLINESTDLPVISLSADPYDLFDPDAGIYTNFTEDWEAPAHVEFFDDEKKLGFSEDCGINIHGSQSANWDQKSFAVKFKDPYNSSSLEYPLFPGFDITTFKSFILRNSGNDWQYTHIRDAMMQTLVCDLDIDYQEYRPATAFVNGEYWGIYNIREKINEHYIANRHGVNPDNIDMLENNMSVIHGDSLDYQELIDYMTTNDMSTDEAYDYVDSKIDMDECILYFAAQAYYDNLDWPGTNVKIWREKTPTGKWRWILFDLDFGFGLYAHGAWEDHIAFMFSTVETRYSNPPWATLFQRKLIENPVIKNRFINQIADLLNTNFKSDRVVEVINTLADHISNELPKHRARWGLFGENLDKVTTFAKDRPGYLRTHVRNYFGCGDNGNLTISLSKGGQVQLNTLTINDSESPWEGIYFQGNPVNVKAIADAGYKFDSWSGDVTSSNDSLTLSVLSSTKLQANFVMDTTDIREIVINEINYNSADDFDSGDWVELYNRSNESVDLSGWYFSDSDDEHKYFIPDGTVLESNNYLVMVDDDSSFTARFPNVENYIGEIGFGLSGSGEFMKLVDNEEQIVDSLTYDDKLPWPEEADGDGASLELVDVNIDNAFAENWKASEGHGSPGEVNSVVTDIEVDKNNELPSEFVLSQNYPNPFNPTTTINYSIPVAGKVSIKVYDILGREIANLVNEVKAAGRYSVKWDASNFASGIYVYRIKANSFIQTKKLVLMK